MKILPLKKLFLSNAPLKIISLFLGYSFWHIASINNPVTVSLSIPLCFNHVPDFCTIQAPENILVTLQAKRSDLYALEKSSLAAHVTINKPLPGKYGIILNENHLFLPHTILLLQYKPSNLSFTLYDKTMQES